MDELQSEILADLTLEVKDDASFNSSKLQQKIKNAIREVKRIRRYPVTYTEEQIKEDMNKFYSNIRNVALYDYNKIGAEGQEEHLEGGITRVYEDRNKLFRGVLPLSRL